MTVTPVVREDEGRSATPIAMEAFQRIAEHWKLSTEEQLKLLGSPGRSTFFKWKKEGGLIPRDTLERISHLLAIWKALQILFTETTSADAWIKRGNAYFQDKSALDVMLEGQFANILAVRQYIDAQRGG